MKILEPRRSSIFKLGATSMDVYAAGSVGDYLINTCTPTAGANGANVERSIDP